MTQKLFVEDSEGLLHEVKTVNGAVSHEAMNQAVQKYGNGRGIPLTKIRLIEVPDNEDDYEDET